MHADTSISPGNDIGPGFDPADEEEDLHRLLKDLHHRFGYDFREYSRAHIKRRIRRRVHLENLSGIPALHNRILEDDTLRAAMLDDLSIPTTEMFRDPEFYRAFREQVAPVLRTYPSFCVWHAGCATGEEVYSMAILLTEENLYDRARIYATDINDRALHTARKGIYPMDRMREYSASYHRAGGTASLSAYYTAQYGAAAIAANLRGHIVIAAHNLVTDSVFREVQVVICRNVLIYFNRSLQARVLSLFHDSLCHRGFLCIGSKESVNHAQPGCRFDALCEKERIFRRAEGPQ